MTDREKLGVRVNPITQARLEYERRNRHVIYAWIGLVVIVAAIVMLGAVLFVLAQDGVL